MIACLAGLARPMLLLMEPERAHETTIRALETGLFSAPAGVDDPRLAVDIWGHHLPNPIGIAAGFDKNGRVPDVLIKVGFGFAEIGTVTPLPQVGNPKPRVFRLIRDRALINRLGFNNAGHIRVKARLGMREKNGVMGVNVGANKDSADRTGDYVRGIEIFYDDADYFMVNISSPIRLACVIFRRRQPLMNSSAGSWQPETPRPTRPDGACRSRSRLLPTSPRPTSLRSANASRRTASRPSPFRTRRWRVRPALIVTSPTRRAVFPAGLCSSAPPSCSRRSTGSPAVVFP